jgi:MoaD family protein
VATVKVRLFHELRTAAGGGEITLDAKNVGELLRVLGGRYGKTPRNVLFDGEGHLRDYAFVYINNILQKPVDMSVPLKDGDVILVIPPVGGGWAIPRFNLYVPLSLDDALNYLEEHARETIPVAGATDLLPRIKKKQIVAKNLVDLSGLSELRYIKREDGKIRIGALTTIADLEAEDDNSIWGEFLNDVVTKFGSPNIRSVATVGGNICAASSSEDLLPVFLVLDAKVKTIRRSGTREVPLQEFMIAKRKTALGSDEILAEVSFQEPSRRSACSFQKLGMRNILIIALVSIAAFLELHEKDTRIKTVRIALNRLEAKIPQRAENVEKEILGNELSERAIETAVDRLGDDLALTSDFRASGEYREEAVKVLLRRALVDCQQRILE